MPAHTFLSCLARRPRSIVALLASVFLAASSAFAGDGVIEINQASALAGGVNGDLVSDPPGFPVTITASGSYRLTGNLEVATNDGAIVVEASEVHIDFTGFSVTGTGLGAGVGVDGTTTGTSYVSVSNGSISAFGGECVKLGDKARVERMKIHDCVGGGVLVGELGVVRGNQIFDTTGAGGIVAGPTTAYEGNQLAGNATADVVGGTATGTNLCDGRGCPGLRRRYFLTLGTYAADQVLDPATCGEGFHMASAYELLDPSNLEYDLERGFVTDDQGTGPPVREEGADPEFSFVVNGFMHSGRSAHANDPTCQLWTSTSASDKGLAGYLYSPQQVSPPAEPESPWHLFDYPCNSTLRVWCIAD